MNALTWTVRRASASWESQRRSNPFGSLSQFGSTPPRRDISSQDLKQVTSAEFVRQRPAIIFWMSQKRQGHNPGDATAMIVPTRTIGLVSVTRRRLLLHDWRPS